ncbi:MAG: hypothetical protein WBD99_15315 [Thermodesulfobacteriota bacterium]
MKRYKYFYLVLTLGFVFRVFLTPYGTYRGDMKTWLKWANGVYEVGFNQFYATYPCDYLPGYIYVLWLLQKIHISLPSLPEKTLFKLPANIADLGIALVIFYSLLKITNHRKAALSSLAFFFNPASIANSTLWGQVDSVNVLPLLIAISIGLRGFFTASVTFAIIGLMIKPLSIVIFPIIGFLILRDIFRRRGENNIEVKRLFLGIKILAASVITMYVFTIPYIGDDFELALKLDTLVRPIHFIYARFIESYNSYPITSANAFNFWGLIHGMWVSDQTKFLNLTYQSWGTIIFTLIYALILISLVRHEIINKDNDLKDVSYLTFQSATLIFFALFLFVTRAHERHLLPAIVFFTMLLFHSRLNWVLYATVSVCYVINMYYAHIMRIPIESFPFKYVTKLMIKPLIPLIVITLISVFVIVIVDFTLEVIENRRNKMYKIDIKQHVKN